MEKSVVNKISILLAFFAIVYLMSCKYSIIGIRGEGDVVKQEIVISKFNKINLAIDADVTIIRGDKQIVEIMAQQNIIDNIKTTIYSGEWSIEYDRNVKNHEPITIIIIIPELSGIYLSGSGDIYSDDMFEQDELELIISGSGNIDYFALSNKINSTISGSGSINIKGITDEQVIKISGSGDYKSFRLESNECDIRIPGSGNCEVFVNNNLFVNISGSGNVYYKGDAVVNSVIPGSGRVIDFN